MVAFLEQRGIDGATVLEVGGGVGEIQIELLKQGAAQAINLELVPSYDPEAQRLLQAAGLLMRAERRLHDIAVDPGGVESADVVVLHRVVCCWTPCSAYSLSVGSAPHTPTTASDGTLLASSA
jgi:magnesium-protoporphyrin O-methyltransferase